MGEPATATVETLTAEVRVLMVGNRQITLSVARQLDQVGLSDLSPFGRVNIAVDGWDHWLIGSHKQTGALVLAYVPILQLGPTRHLPLIVLAGLR